MKNELKDRMQAKIHRLQSTVAEFAEERGWMHLING